MAKDLPTRGRRPPAPALEERRSQIVSALAAAFAADRLTIAQLEERMDMAQRVDNADDLELLIADLPAVAAEPETGVAVADPAAVRDRQVLVALMGGVERKGHWVPARRTVVVALMGGAVIDLREAPLPPEGIEISVFTMWGGAEILVPPTVRVDMGGIAIMGGFSQNRGHEPQPSTGAPTVRINGLAVMGGVEVNVRYPGESARDARLRNKAEKKRLRRGGSGDDS